jgi:hypothetical protein
MILIIEGVVGIGSGRTKNQGSKGESHRRAHVDLHVDLMLVGLVRVCFHSFIMGERGWGVDSHNHKLQSQPWMIEIEIVVGNNNNDNHNKHILLTVILID